MNPRDTIDGIVEHVAEWISLNVHGVVWIRYESDVARDACIEKLGKYFACPPITFDPPDPKLAAVWLEDQLSSIPAANPLPVVCLKFPISLAGSEQSLLDAIYSLNLRREDLLQRPLVQVWWISERLSPLAENIAPDLNSWFKLHLSLRQSTPEPSFSEDLWEHASFFNRLRLEPGSTRQLELEEMKLQVGLLRARSEPQAKVDLANALSKLSIRFAAEGHWDLALSAGHEAVNHFENLAGRDPMAFLPSLAESLNNLAVLQSQIGNRKEALKSIEQSSRLYKELSKHNRDAFLPEYAMSLANYAMLQSDVGKREEALENAEIAAKLYRELSKKNPGRFLTDLAKALNNLATLQSKLGSHRDGVVTAQEAVAIQQELVNQGMELSIPDLATALGTLANRQAEIGQIEDALRNLEKSVNLRRDLVKRNRKAFLPDLAGTLNNSAIWQSKAGRSEDALASGLEAVALRQELTDLNGKTFLPDLVQSLGALSALYMSRNEFSKATAVSRKALSLILPYFEQQQEMFSSILQDVVQGYLEACRKSTTVPDQALLARIPPISRPNRKRPPAPADGPLPNPKT